MACVYQIQGIRYRKRYNSSQDVTIEVSKPGVTILGLFDGHGRRGLEVATITARELTALLLQQLNIRELISGISNKISSIFYAYALSRKDHPWFQNSGTTATVVIDIGENLVFCSAGDSSVMWQEPGRPRQTVLHIVTYPPEQARIRQFSGIEIHRNRLWSRGHGLTLTRGIGNFSMTPPENFNTNNFLISPYPSIEIVSKADLYSPTYVLASDGVTDVLDIVDIMDLATLRRHSGISDDTPICRYICEIALELGSKDDITTMVVDAHPSRTLSVVMDTYFTIGFNYTPRAISEYRELRQELEFASNDNIFYGKQFETLANKLEKIIGEPLLSYEYDTIPRTLKTDGIVVYINISENTYVVDAHTRDGTTIAFGMLPGSIVYMRFSGFVERLITQTSPIITDYSHILLLS